MSVLDVHTAAETLRDIAAAALNIVGEEDGLDGAPERQLVTPGLPVDDCCEQVAVHVGPVTKLAIGNQPKRAWRSQVTFTISTGRCIPGPDDDGEGPSVAALEESARQINADGWALWNAVNNAIADRLVFAECDPVNVGPLTDRNPSGGCGGWTLQIDAVVDGFATEVAS